MVCVLSLFWLVLLQFYLFWTDLFCVSVCLFVLVFSLVTLSFLFFFTVFTVLIVLTAPCAAAGGVVVRPFVDLVVPVVSTRSLRS